VYVSCQVIIFSRGEKLNDTRARSNPGLCHRGLENVLYSIPNDRVRSVDALGNAEFEAIASQLLAVSTLNVDGKSVYRHFACGIVRGRNDERGREHDGIGRAKRAKALIRGDWGGFHLEEAAVIGGELSTAPPLR
jgi:hypothetical protein